MKGTYRIKLAELLGGFSVLALVLGFGFPTASRTEWMGNGIRDVILFIVVLIALLFEIIYWFGLVRIFHRLGSHEKRNG
jgi:hypothetical protein